MDSAVDTFGYIARSQAHYYPWSTNIYIIQQLLILLAPALFAASIYMTLGRIILFTQAETLAPIPARWLTKIFVCGDVLSFVVQSAGKLSSLHVTLSGLSSLCHTEWCPRHPPLNAFDFTLLPMYTLSNISKVADLWLPSK